MKWHANFIPVVICVRDDNVSVDFVLSKGFRIASFQSRVHMVWLNHRGMNVKCQINKRIATRAQHDAIVWNQLISTSLVNINCHLVTAGKEAELGTDVHRLLLLQQIYEAHATTNSHIFRNLKQAEGKGGSIFIRAIRQECRGECLAGSKFTCADSRDFGQLTGGIGFDLTKGRIHKECLQRNRAALRTCLFYQGCGAGDHRSCSRCSTED
mmetsp:Transcript_15137/g.36149  ORF Transcript_15137/g.36149 Transcript_15137/m.36149 type:complete len:211 (-) Transcript_15137:298-930(-)